MEPSALSDVAGLVSSLGIGGICLFLYWNERKDRIEAEKAVREAKDQLNITLREVLTTMNEATNTQKAFFEWLKSRQGVNHHDSPPV